MDPAVLLTSYVVLGIILVWTSIIDIKTREVPDWLSASLIMLGFGFAIITDVVTATLGGLAIAIVLSELFILGWFVDGFVFFPNIAAQSEDKPWWTQLGASLGLCIAAIAISFALTELAPTIARALAGAAAGYAVGVILYWTKQWGGGDAKLLAGVGAILGFDVQYGTQVITGIFLPAPSFVWFLALLLVCGAVYGAGWLAVLAIMYRKKFLPVYHTTLASMRVMRIATWCVTALLLVAAVTTTIRSNALFGTLFVVLAALTYGGFYLVVAVKAAEKSLMLIQRTPAQLVAGDWVMGPVVVGKATIIPTSSAGVTEREIAALRKAAPKKIVTIRQGVPFVPSFLLAFIVLVALRWMVFR